MLAADAKNGQGHGDWLQRIAVNRLVPYTSRACRRAQQEAKT
jgi:hypothetical protein